ncbi:MULTISPECIES: hypothetical protein [Burkholderia cepacia complex]|uniref:hypothetical protein n=1 Tax=Burkholderia cepacia complex TaxID=87882 RepID=UPI00158C213B|nr:MULTISPECIES: hypothetical protein [Burkholderia cepacia complex]MDR8878076.1 hypothetical protein [Burkholderia multivorans]MDR8882426.1 hypothetical protein [Burkholderia multivorans]MDR8889514.1 hypothetical protein [Burkholderia multivorans]MDR8908267.1 hypothetical protein [Burkholderia multivorans]MDR8915067.1 hypothetical protein [Burkholderia multivorans]
MRIFFRSTSRILRASKTHAKITGLPLQTAQNEVAYILGYADLHELQQVAAAGEHPPSPDDEDLSPDDLHGPNGRRAWQAKRLCEYRRAPGRKPLDAMTARAIVDDVRASARVRSASSEGARNEPKRYPPDEIIYGIVVRASTTRAELAGKSQILTRMDPDRIVLLSVAPHDITKRPDWLELELLFTSVAAHIAVERVKEDDIDHIATEISVMA